MAAHAAPVSITPAADREARRGLAAVPVMYDLRFAVSTVVADPGPVPRRRCSIARRRRCRSCRRKTLPQTAGTSRRARKHRRGDQPDAAVAPQPDARARAASVRCAEAEPAVELAAERRAATPAAAVEPPPRRLEPHRRAAAPEPDTTLGRCAEPRRRTPRRPHRPSRPRQTPSRQAARPAKPASRKAVAKAEARAQEARPHRASRRAGEQFVRPGNPASNPFGAQQP